MLGDWVLTKLSGRVRHRRLARVQLGHVRPCRAATGPTRSSPSAGSSVAVFPPIVESGTVIGSVTAQAASETGLNEGTPVVVGGADTQLGLLGIGANGPGRFTILGGSFWQHTMLLDKPVVDPRSRLRTLCHTTAWALDDGGNRLLLRHGHALVPRRVL